MGSMLMGAGFGSAPQAGKMRPELGKRRSCLNCLT